MPAFPRNELEEMVRLQVQRYCPSEEAEQEFTLEWGSLGDYLSEHGGLEEAVRRAYELFDPTAAKKHRRGGMTGALTRLTSIIRSSDGANPSSEAT